MNERSTKRRCEECGDAERPRGRWSPYFCEPCDLERMLDLDKDMEKLAKAYGIPFTPMRERDAPQTDGSDG